MKKLILFILILGCSVSASAQDPMIQQIVEDILESAGENRSDETDFQEILDDLIRFKQNPLNVNQATVAELVRLHLLSSLQIENLLSFRQKTGTIYSIYEMASIEGFTPDVLQRLEPFVGFAAEEFNLGPRKSNNALILRSSKSFTSGVQPETTNYEGSMERYYLRFRRESAHSEFGFVAEKDPGETFFSQSNKQGFDYYSAYASFKLGKAGNRLYAGDYIVRFGQGLVAWQGFAMGKSSETTQIFRSDEGIRSYSSTDENLFFRGVAARVKVGNALFFPFVSYHRVDAHVDTLAEQTWFGAFQTSGYHRTASEIAGENAIDQFTAGGHASYSYKRWAFGLTSVFNRFSTNMIPDDQPYNLFLPRGKDNFVAGCDWKGSLDKIYFFGEAAVSTNSGKAILTGLMLKPASNAELSLVYRNINTRYFSYFSSAFTESSRINDEQALYFGLKFFPAAHWSVLAYADLFRSKWIKYTTAAPSAGTEMMAQLSFVPTRKTSFYLRFFQEEKDQKEITDLLKYNVNQLINRLRLNYAQILNEKFSMKSRIEFSFYSRESQEMGFLIFQDAVYKSQQRPFSINGRIAYFNTDGYNS